MFTESDSEPDIEQPIEQPPRRRSSLLRRASASIPTPESISLTGSIAELDNEKDVEEICGSPIGRCMKFYTLPLLALCVTFAAGIGVGKMTKAPIVSNPSESTYIEETLVASVDPNLFESPPSADQEDEKWKLSILHDEMDEEQAMLHNTELDRDIADVWSYERDIKEQSSVNLHRKLAARPNMFTELACNANINTAPCTTTLSSLISSTTGGSPVTIPCGVCVTVDQNGGQYTQLASGLRIEGKLHFPPSAFVTIRTIFVLVLGVLKMDVPASGNIVMISLYGEDDIYFSPTSENSAACSSTGCNIGKKAIAVAGGHLDIEGYAPQCPAWEKVQDVGRSGITRNNPPSTCSGNQIINGNANAGTASWNGWGNPIMVEDGGLKAYGRTSSYQSAFQFLPVGCFAEGQTWKLSAKVKLYNEATGTALDCNTAFSGNNDCPFVRLHAKPSDYFQEVRDYSMVWNKSGWSNFEADFYVPSVLITGTTSMLLHMAGGPAGSAILWDDIVLEPTHAIDQIRVSPSSAGCWTAGTELVITSHTRWNTDEQVVLVASSDPNTGFVTLTKPIIKPVTLADSPDFAVEVASLTRPIIFEADSSPSDALTGGHLIIMNTPGVAQHIEGVAIRNFGQQGTLGRYPIHFHMCETVPGSIVKKNVVRDSNQRCYVIHGSHQVTMEDNVAYNTAGHCYFLEDGSEQNNTFTRNIGIKTSKAVRLVSAQSGRTESDNMPSVFWISNPLNHFSGNIAAGSERFGFWFETHSVIRGGSDYQLPSGFNAAFESLGAFNDNEAHSCQDTAFTSYPPGWMPASPAEIVNLKTYRNAGRGMFLHVTRNLKFIDGIVADNGYEGVLINRGDNITFIGTKIIGLTAGADRHVLCKQGYSPLGFVVHPTKMQEFDYTGTIKGLTLINVEITRWTPAVTGCGASTAAVSIGNQQAFNPVFSAPTSFTNVKIEGSFDGCRAQSILVNDTVIEVTDGSLTGTPGFLVQPGAKAFAGSCVPFDKCLDFCAGTCLRTVRFLTNSARNTAKMVVTAGTGISATFLGRLRGDDIGAGDTSFPLYHREFAVSLPTGSYQVSFMNAANELIFPEYVIPVFEKAPSCSGYVAEGDVVIVKPAITSARCDQLVENGGFDDGLAFWQNINTKPIVTAGMLTTTTRTKPMAYDVVQWLDTSCFQTGDRYNLTLDYRLVDSSGVNVVGACDVGGSCPSAYLIAGDFNSITGIVTNTWMDLGKTNLPYNTGTSFNTISGSWTVSSAQAVADKMSLVITQGFGQLILDNVKLTKVSVTPNSTPTKTPTTLAPVTEAPTKAPTTFSPSQSPTKTPTTLAPVTEAPTKAPTTFSPSQSPTKTPTTPAPVTEAPTKAPTTFSPSQSPTKTPTTLVPVTEAPTNAPTTATAIPTTSTPTSKPTTVAPTRTTTTPKPTRAPTTPKPTRAPTTPRPTRAPTTPKPTRAPTTPKPTRAPTTPRPTTNAPIPA